MGSVLFVVVFYFYFSYCNVKRTRFARSCEHARVSPNEQRWGLKDLGVHHLQATLAFFGFLFERPLKNKFDRRKGLIDNDRPLCEHFVSATAFFGITF